MAVAAAGTTPAEPGYRPARFPSISYALGMASIFLGERVLDSGKPQNTAVLLGVALLLVALGARVLRQGTLPPSQRPPERMLLGLYLLGIGAVALYFLNSDLLLRLTGRSLEQRLPRFSGVLSALWPALWLAGTLPVLFVELSLWSMAKAPLLELGRVQSAMRAGLGIAFALVFCFGITYVAAERDVRADFSFFRTSRAGESTKKIVAALDRPVQVHLFFPPANEVREEIEGYFAELSRLSKLLEVQRWDQALHPAKARELGVSGNGAVVIARDALKEQIAFPLELERSRGQLKTLDQEVQKRLLAVTRKRKVAYFTVGHDERSGEAAGDNDKRTTLRTLKAILTDQNFEAKDLGMAQGLGNEVPADAGVVIVAGPRQPFQPAEVTALMRYLDRNGRLLVALDPEAGQTMPELLGPLSLKYNPVTLATDRMYLPINYQESDRINVGLATFSSHVSVTTNSRMGARAPVLMMGAGSLSKQEKTAAGIVNLDMIIRTDSFTWNDVNGNFKHDEGTEVRTTYDVAAAVTKRNASAIAPEEEGRAVVLADSDVLADVAQRVPGNRYLVIDSLRWLGGEERFSGAVSNEEDVPIAHTRKQNLVWFYLSIFLVPTLVLGLGFVMTRRRRSAKRASKAPPGEAPRADGSNRPAAPPAPAPPEPRPRRHRHERSRRSPAGKPGLRGLAAGVLHLAAPGRASDRRGVRAGRHPQRP